MQRSVVLMLFCAALCTAQALHAEDKADVTDMQVLRNAVRADRKAFVASTLALTDAEAKKFWPAYELYQRSLDTINRRRVMVLEQVIGNDRALTDPFARNLASELTAVDEAEIKIRRTLQNRVMKALPARKAARYMQLEAKIRAVQAYDVAATIPLVK